ncbi:MAG: Gldg family protein, partial [Pseudomonadales bacterium]|nr:Gldg family protein [Pseudomonadales bacterium]
VVLERARLFLGQDDYLSGALCESLEQVSLYLRPRMFYLYFFFSSKASENLTQLRAYAQRVRELLVQYEDESDGKIRLHFVDPEPFSDEEDQATAFGLQAVPTPNGNDLYFGIAGTNSVNNEESIAFLQPDKEKFLEYDISRLVQTLSKPDLPVVGLMSSLKINGDVDMQTFQTTPPWTVVEQLGQVFKIRNVGEHASVIPEDVDVLVIVHPKGLSDDSLRAIDQFAMKGGRILAFVDPLAESDRGAGQGMPSSPIGKASDLNRLLGKWGVTMETGKVIGDQQYALQVNGPEGRPVRHLAILGLQKDSLSREDVVTSSLDSVNVSTAGILDIAKDATTDITPLITSSKYAAPIDVANFQVMSNPEDLEKGFSPTGERYVIAARLSGHAESAFAPKDKKSELVTSTDDLNVIVVADTDILTDRLWVHVQNFFGQRIASPWANNGDLVVNAVDNLVGSASLISIRSRGRFSRPFDVVQDLRREAESQYLQSANDLQAQLSEAEQKLTALQNEKKENNLLSLSPEQEKTLEQFQQEKVRIRKQLRDVRHQLDKDIEALGTMLKFLDIFLIPLVLTLLLIAVNYVRTRREVKAGE